MDEKDMMLDKHSSNSGMSTITATLSSVLLIFYFAIILYILIAVLNADTAKNFVCAVVFQSIGFILLVAIVMSKIVTGAIKIGFFAPLVMVTVVYQILLDVINIGGVLEMSSVMFVLLHLIVLFIYCVIAFPMIIMGAKKD